MNNRLMKKRWIIILCTAGCCMLAPADAEAQGFLKKMKQKAEKALNKVTGVDEEPKEESAPTNENPMASTPTATDRIPKLRQSTLVWDGEVRPSSASTVQQLLNELPPLPNLEDVVQPDETKREAYYRRLRAIELRVEELDDQWACSDEEMLAAREKIYKEMESFTGLTAAEMKRLEDPNLPEAERTRLEEKVKNHMLGGTDMDALSAKAQSKEERLEQIEKEMEALEKKEKKGTLTEADKQRMMELSQEAMAMHQDLMNSGMGNLMNISKQADAISQNIVGDQAEMNRRLKALSDKITAVGKNEEGVVKSCDQIAAEYEDRLKVIYERVYRSNDVDSIHILYGQADELMKNYRTRAAKIFLHGLQVRLDNTKKLLPEAEAVYKEMADNGMIPQCATRRTPLNLVTRCVDILNEAYAAFPQPEVLPVQVESFSFLKKGERVLYGESGFAGGFSTGTGSGIIEEFIAGSHLLVFNEGDQCYYEIKNGQRRNLGKEEQGWNYYKHEKQPDEVYGDIPLRKGGRKAIYSRDGALTLHDGTTFSPVLMKRYNDRLEFIVPNFDSKSDQQYVKCTYKL